MKNQQTNGQTNGAKKSETKVIPALKRDTNFFLNFVHKCVVSAVACVWGGVVCCNGKTLPGDCDITDFGEWKRIVSTVQKDGFGVLAV